MNRGPSDLRCVPKKHCVLCSKQTTTHTTPKTHDEYLPPSGPASPKSPNSLGVALPSRVNPAALSGSVPSLY